MDDEHSRLIGSSEVEDGTVRYKLKGLGQWYISSGSVIYSSYADTYDSAVLGSVLTERELKDIVSRLNDKLQSHWPCSPVLLFGALCCPCSLGASLLFPQFCLTQSEAAANDMLSNVSLKARFYDRHIEFAIVKAGWCRTHLEVRFPSRPHLRGSADFADFGSNSNINSNSSSSSNSNSHSHVFTSEPSLSSEYLGVFLAQPAMPPREENATTTTSNSSGSNNSNDNSNKKAL